MTGSLWDDDDGVALSRDILIVGYALSAVLLVLYFAFEEGICHRSQGFESIYLSVIVFFVYGLASIWGELNDETQELKSAYRLRQIMRLVLAMHLLLFWIFPEGRLGFFREDTGRLAAKKWLPTATRMARHKAQDLETLVLEALAVAQGGIGGLVARVMGPVLFLLFMLEDFLFAYSELMDKLQVPLLVVVIAMHTIFLLQAYRKFRRFSKLRNRIQGLVKDLVDRKATDVLTHCLANINVATLMEVCTQETMDHLVRRAIQFDLLNAVTKAILISALQAKGIRGRRFILSAVRDLFLSCHGEELTTLKTLLDAGGIYQNLFKLIYNDIWSHRVREEIVQHFRRESLKYRKRLGHPVGVKVLSDMDDTLTCSGGHFPAGCDKRYPRRTVYPGYLQLVQSLDRSWRHDMPSCNIVFLSARPHVYKDVTEERSFQFLEGLVNAGRMHSFPTLLPGKLRAGLWTMLTIPFLRQHAWRRVGDLKYLTYLQYREMYSEYDFVFFGDNGQGDLYAGERMIQEEKTRSTPPLLQSVEPFCPRVTSDAESTCSISILGRNDSDLLPKAAQSYNLGLSSEAAYSGADSVSTTIAPNADCTGSSPMLPGRIGGGSPLVASADPPASDRNGSLDFKLDLSAALETRVHSKVRISSSEDCGTGGGNTKGPSDKMRAASSTSGSGSASSASPIVGSGATSFGAKPPLPPPAESLLLESSGSRGNASSGDEAGTGGTSERSSAAAAAAADSQRPLTTKPSAEPTPRLLGVIIHQVFPEKDQLCLAQTSLKADGEPDDRLVLHRTYLGAALTLHQRFPELVTVSDLASVAEHAVEEFDAIRWAKERWGERWLAAEVEVMQDFETVNSYLESKGIELKVACRSLTQLRIESGWQIGACKKGLIAKLTSRKRGHNAWLASE